MQGFTAQGEECFRSHASAAAAEAVTESVGPTDTGLAVVQGAPSEGGGIAADQTANFGDSQHGLSPAALPQPGEHGLQFPSKSIARQRLPANNQVVRWRCQLLWRRRGRRQLP